MANNTNKYLSTVNNMIGNMCGMGFSLSVGFCAGAFVGSAIGGVAYITNDASRDNLLCWLKFGALVGSTVGLTNASIAVNKSKRQGVHDRVVNLEEPMDPMISYLLAPMAAGLMYKNNLASRDNEIFNLAAAVVIANTIHPIISKI